ncbi:MAG: hypothetical protein E7422_06955 [Ruminococcaceae bacterium]|nr:hypothetical protein [Oscillospiraceae bacterium]
MRGASLMAYLDEGESGEHMADMTVNRTEIHGKDVLPTLARRYRQLYLAPGEEGAERYKAVVRRGEAVEGGSLAHFRGSEEDSLTWEETPAGAAQIVTLHERADFEVFLQIMAHRCAETAIPATQGAMLLDGVINWRRIEAHKDAFLAQRAAEGETHPDWAAEFKRFTADKANYTDALIVLSAGPYSGVGAARVGLREDEWLRRSLTIRKYHECTHFVCRRKFPEWKDAVWDELVADCVGVYAAFGRLVPELVELFLGIDGGRYVGGRLENYVDAPDAAEKARRLDALAPVLHGVLGKFENNARQQAGIAPLELALIYESAYEELGGLSEF